ncbi:unnamed protein product [Fusarium graminearum]|uniref:Chromosome 1, complete genome n=1 Tax=Gibberella zeae (strain ATCC MYA-4620 / CBS 123657 / FGSC 9075 / NRRL 31084 / PH-1) TaxID=229533 RepID=A0A098DB74_GIBZE|nr:unnamed protein product [Fusarium graminearum]
MFPLPSTTVLVTGANGYLGLHVLNQLLRDDKTVCAVVRSDKAIETVRANFKAYIESNQLRIITVEDLTKPESFQNVLDETIASIAHIASPCPMGKNIRDNVRDMLSPAITGTTPILNAAKTYASPSLRRVVQISSFSAMLDLSKGSRPRYVYTEADWNPMTYKEAMVKKNKPRLDIVCLCPSTIFGPHIETIDSMVRLQLTASLLWNLVNAPEVPSLDFAGAVDVRDAALMVVAAIDKPEAGGRRFLLAEHFDWQSAANAARDGLSNEGRSRIPAGEPGFSKDKALNSLYTVDRSKAVDVLGIRYRPLGKTVVNTLRQFLKVDARETYC